ncbi:hypothetical protein M8C21_029193 [Ambrosia artemisiifolia]|uniref:Uncharacterized protein n=1 Tax=Ambrosia artemisiifolia TaxID=4212 RepID=A0AAD5DHN9_AMBAR|nr:hypothetical protein M8C21_029193 [Ambrosia artemisiifolia]
MFNDSVNCGFLKQRTEKDSGLSFRDEGQLKAKSRVFILKRHLKNTYPTHDTASPLTHPSTSAAKFDLRFSTGHASTLCFLSPVTIFTQRLSHCLRRCLSDTAVKFWPVQVASCMLNERLPVA